MEEIQQKICRENQSAYCPLHENELLLVEGSNFEQRPIFGCRITDWNTSGKQIQRWVLAFGTPDNEQTDPEETYISLEEIQQKCPDVLPFLALEEGFNFIIDEEGDSEIWKEI